MPFRTPQIKELERAREAFEANEPRDLFYRAATELVDLAIREQVSLTVAEALAVLLQTWNRAYYQYRKFDREHFADIERLLSKHRAVLESVRGRTIEGFSSADGAMVEGLFRDFELVLGPVGAAKCLHLLAPRFFPLWDRDIAKAYLVSLRKRGRNGERYCRFMRIVEGQWRDLGGEQRIGRNPLKALNEYNYCKYTKEWM